MGGQKLKSLRERVGFSQVVLAAEAQIGNAHVSNIEAGIIEQPTYETLDKLLTALNASFAARRDVLEAFGYRVPYSLPTEQEIEDAHRLCEAELNDVTVPVYLMDDGQRLLAWNRYVPRLIGVHPDDPLLVHFHGVTLIDLALNPRYATTFLIDNRDEFLPMWLRIIKTSLDPFREEQWYIELIMHARELPRFSEIWDSISVDPIRQVSTERIIPLKVAVPSIGVLSFRLASQPFILDRRFQLLSYIPFGATTLRQCANWAEEEGML
jgi:transcriptional regulator with XRE-family HTH domain